MSLQEIINHGRHYHLAFTLLRELTGLVHHGLHGHMSNTLQLVIDNQLGYKLDETKHVDSLSKGGNDERVPSSVSLVHYFSSADAYIERTSEGTYRSIRCIQLRRE
jgi:hypothetical protein